MRPKDQRSESKLNPYCLSSDEAGVRLSMSDNSTAYGVRDNESLYCLSVPRAVTTVRLIGSLYRLSVPYGQYNGKEWFGSQPVTDRAQWRQSLPLTAYAVRAQCLYACNERVRVLITRQGQWWPKRVVVVLQ